MAPPTTPPNNNTRNVYAAQPLNTGNIRGTGAEQAIADIDQFRGGAIIVQYDAQPVRRTAEHNLRCQAVKSWRICWRTSSTMTSLTVCLRASPSSAMRLRGPSQHWGEMSRTERSSKGGEK
nr:hypothetical protein B0A51_17162 [Rachicladosporium sp. CCFEE 5018]